MAKAKRIVVHCTATRQGQRFSKVTLYRIFFVERRWHHWGYHAVVYENGEWEILQPLPKATAKGGFIDNTTMANGAQGYNMDSLHIAYMGGLDKDSGQPADTRTEAQKQTLRVLIAEWKHIYHIDEVIGHYQLPNVHKACPCFDAKKEYENV